MAPTGFTFWSPTPAGIAEHPRLSGLKPLLWAQHSASVAYDGAVSPGWRIGAAVCGVALSACAGRETSEDAGLAAGSATVLSTGGSSGFDADSFGVPQECETPEDCPPPFPCNSGRCVSCVEEPALCVDNEVCVSHQCRRVEDLTACEGTGYSLCGNGVLQAGEACDGAVGCEDCQTDPPAMSPWGQRFDVSRLAVAQDGGVAALTYEDGSNTLTVLDARGSVQWSRRLSGGVRALVWSGPQLFVWGDELLVFTALGELRRRGSLGGLVPHAAAAWEAGAIVAGAVEQPNSGVTRGVVRALNSEGHRVWESKLGDVREVSTLTVVEGEAVVAGLHVDLPRSVVKRMNADGSERWSDTMTEDLERDALVVFPDGAGGNWLFSDDGSATRFDAEGATIDRMPCFGFVRGHLERVAVGPRSEVALLFQVFDLASRSWGHWVVRGQPDEAQFAWTPPALIRGLEWTPQGQLLVGFGGQIWQVSFE